MQGRVEVELASSFCTTEKYIDSRNNLSSKSSMLAACMESGHALYAGLNNWGEPGRAPHKRTRNIIGASLSERNINGTTVREIYYYWGEPERASHKRYGNASNIRQTCSCSKFTYYSVGTVSTVESAANKRDLRLQRRREQERARLISRKRLTSTEQG